MSGLRSRAAVVLMTACITLNPAPARAQSAAPASVTHDSTAHAHLFTRSDAWILGGFLVGTALARPLDSNIARDIRKPGPQNNHFASHAADVFNFLGSPGTVIASVGMYGVGRIGHIDHLADLGLHSTEAIAVSGAITTLIKGIAGRQRPGVAGVDDPDDFKFGGGFGKHGNTSFPSGHSTASFALATMVTLETHRWQPKSTWYVAPIMYGGATLVGLARLYVNAHWTSDVIMGAGIGTLTSLKVFRFNHVTDRNNRVDRWLLAAPTVSPGFDGRGVNLGWSFAAPR